MTFEGFVPPTKNYFPVPNNWIDICATIRDISELKVIQYVIRHTWGFHEFGICKTISVDEFMHGRRRQDQTRMDSGTGLSEQSVRNGLNKAIKHRYLICEVDPSDAGRIKKSYALRMQANTGQVQTLDPPQSLDPPTGTNFIPQGTNPYTSDSQSLDPRVPNFIPRTEKDTLERHSRKTPIERQESIATSVPEDRNAPAENVSDFSEWKRKTDPHLPVIDTAYHIANSGYEKDEEPTEKRAAVKPSQHTPAASVSLSLAVTPPGGSQDDTGGRQAHLSPGSLSTSLAVPITPAAPVGVSVTGTPPASPEARQGGSVIPKRPKPTPQPKSDTHEIQRRIDEHRGYGLEEKVDIVRERQAIKTWCNLHTLEEYMQVMAGLRTHKYWGKDEHYYRIGGLILLRETPEILARQRQPLQLVSNGHYGQSDMVEWQGQLMTVAEADERGYNGGFGLYK